MSEHVKEPWQVDENALHIIIDKRSILVADTYCCTNESDNYANAKRIVAAVNACAGLDIPDNVPVGAIANVVQSLRTLITECRVYRIQAGCEEQESTYMDEARSALAKLDAK